MLACNRDLSTQQQRRVREEREAALGGYRCETWPQKLQNGTRNCGRCTVKNGECHVLSVIILVNQKTYRCEYIPRTKSTGVPAKA